MALATKSLTMVSFFIKTSLFLDSRSAREVVAGFFGVFLVFEAISFFGTGEAIKLTP